MDFLFPTETKKMPSISSSDIKTPILTPTVPESKIKYENIVNILTKEENKGKNLILQEKHSPYNKWIINYDGIKLCYGNPEKQMYNIIMAVWKDDTKISYIMENRMKILLSFANNKFIIEYAYEGWVPELKRWKWE